MVDQEPRFVILANQVLGPRTLEQLVRLKGLEPSRELPHSDLNAARLPIPPQPHVAVSF